LTYKLRIADIANFGWVNSAAWAGIDIEEFPTLKAWWQKIKGREGVQRGLDVPEKNKYKDITDPKELDRVAKEASQWIMKGQEADKKK
jgi:glutathione S-transferase